MRSQLVYMQHLEAQVAKSEAELAAHRTLAGTKE